MKVRELAIVIANILGVAAKLGQGNVYTINGKDVVMMAAGDVLEMSQDLTLYCNKLNGLIPDTELEFDDASHRDDE